MTSENKAQLTIVPTDNYLVYLVRVISLLFCLFLLTTDLSLTGTLILYSIILVVNVFVKTEYNYFYDDFYEQIEYYFIPFFCTKIHIDYKTIKSMTFFRGGRNLYKYVTPNHRMTGVDIKDTFVIIKDDNTQFKIIINGDNSQIHNAILFFTKKVKDFTVEEL